MSFLYEEYKRQALIYAKGEEKDQVNGLQLWSLLDILINANQCSNQSTLSKFLRLQSYALKALERCGCTAFCCVLVCVLF